MKRSGTNYTATVLGDVAVLGRVTLNAELGLTGSEISVNELPAGASIPFVHSHKQNEEVYIILKGSGLFHVDGNEFEVGEGSVVRVAPAGARCLKADEHDAMRYLCIQSEAGSLHQFTEKDGVLLESRPSWLN